MLLSIFNGKEIVPFVSAKDHKKIGEGEVGLNTGGMGVLAPNPLFNDEHFKAFEEDRVAEEMLTYNGHNTWRPPVWPLLIAGIFLMFGYKLVYLLIFKILLHLLGIFLFSKTLKFLQLKPVLISFGTILYAFSPAYQLYSRVFLSEPITMFFITLWLYFLISYLKKRSPCWVQGVIGGIVVLSHPYFLFLPFTTWLVLLVKKQISFKSLILSSALCASVIATWMVRNIVVLETNEIILTTSSGVALAKGWNEDVPVHHTNTKGDLANESLVLKNYSYDRGKQFGEVEKMVLYKEATLEFIKSNPDLIFPIMLKKIKSAFNPFPETPKPGILEAGRAGSHFLALISMLFLLLFSKNPLIKSLILGLFLSTLAITVLTYSGFRFRMPQAGLELIFIVIALEELGKIPALKPLAETFTKHKPPAAAEPEQ